MNTRAYLSLSRTAGVSLLPGCSVPETTKKQRCGRLLRTGFVVALAMLLTPAIEGGLFAQQTGYPSDVPQAPPNEQGYAPAPPQQPAYAQQPSDDQAPPPPDAGQAYPEAGAQQALAPEQLEQLVAPIALYPDSLVAEVVAAATYPAQIVDADHWRQAQGDAPPEQIAAGADAQPWDPSVKALTAFPQVLEQLSQNLSWTTELGNAYYNQPQDVLNAVQSLRERAQASGTLESTPQETVNDDQGYIALAPANPQVVYVPEYDPWTVYGQPVAPYPSYSMWGDVGSFLGSNVLQYGLGIALSAFTHMSWGWPMWGLDWLGQSLLFHGGGWYSHSRTVADWGLPHGGPRAYGWRGGYGDRGYAGERAYYGRQGSGYYGNRGGYLGDRGFHEYGAGPARLAAERGDYRSGYGTRGEYGRPAQEAYNRAPGMNGRSDDRPGSAYGQGFYGRSGSYDRGSDAYGRGARSYSQNFARPETFGRNDGAGWRQPEAMNSNRGYAGNFGRQGSSYRGYGESYRSPAQSYGGSAHQTFQASQLGRSSGWGRPSRGFGGYSEKMPRSGGSHFFGGNRAPKGFSGGGHFGGGGHSGGGHGGGHFGGGHSGGGGHGHRR